MGEQLLGSRAPRNGAPAAQQSRTFDELLAGLEPNVVSYWKFENDGVDAYGVQNAVISGAPELDLESIVHFDTIAEGAPADGKCIAWTKAAGEYAEAAHNAAHKTAAGTIIVTHQHDTLSEKSVLVCGDANGTAGGFSIEVDTDGSSRAFLRNSAGTPVVLTGAAGDVQIGRAYATIFKWGEQGLSLALWNDRGNLVRRLTDPLASGLSGTSPIRFGAWHTDVAHHDGPYARVIWLNRRIADEEEVHLASARTIQRVLASETLVFSDTFGWLPDPIPSLFSGGIQANRSAIPRFSRVLAPDGTMAVRHQISQGEIVETLAWDSPVFYPPPGYRVATLRCKAWFVNHRNEAGKYMSFMGGCGQAGSQYQENIAKVSNLANGDRHPTGNEGWSFYMTSGKAMNDPRGPVGCANRSELGADCKPGAKRGGDPINGDTRHCFEPPGKFSPNFSIPLGRWIDIEFRSVMNDPNQRNGEAVFKFDGRTASFTGVMWALNPLASPELWMRWRFLYGGIPANLPAPNAVTEYYKDFEIVVEY